MARLQEFDCKKCGSNIDVMVENKIQKIKCPYCGCYSVYDPIDYRTHHTQENINRTEQMLRVEHVHKYELDSDKVEFPGTPYSSFKYTGESKEVVSGYLLTFALVWSAIVFVLWFKYKDESYIKLSTAIYMALPAFIPLALVWILAGFHYVSVRAVNAVCTRLKR